MIDIKINNNLLPYVNSKSLSNTSLSSISNYNTQKSFPNDNISFRGQKQINKKWTFLERVKNSFKNTINYEKLNINRKILLKKINNAKTEEDKLEILKSHKFENLSEKQYKNIIARDLLHYKNANNTLFSNSEIAELAQLDDNIFSNISKRDLLSRKNADGKAYSGYEIADLAQISDNIFNFIDKYGSSSLII